MFLSTPDYLWNNSETQKNLHFWKIFCDMVCDGGVGGDRALVTSLRNFTLKIKFFDKIIL